jgi:hypothetical protein
VSFAAFSRAPGTIPSHVNPPRPSDSLLAGAPEQPKIAAAAPSAQPTQVATAAPSEQSEGLFGGLARKMGLSGAIAADTTATASTQPAAAPAKPKVSAAKPPRPEASIPRAAPKADGKQAAHPPLKPSISDQPAAASSQAPAAIAGAQPRVSSNSFDSRFSASQ